MPLQNKKTPEWLTTGQESRGSTKSRIQLLSQKDEKPRRTEEIEVKGLQGCCQGASKTEPESDNKSLLSTIFPHHWSPCGAL